MRTMLGITVNRPPLPATETRVAFLHHYAACSSERIGLLSQQTDVWFEEAAPFFDVLRIAPLRCEFPAIVSFPTSSEARVGCPRQ